MNKLLIVYAIFLSLGYVQISPSVFLVEKANRVNPPDCMNVKDAPYNAKGNGTTDDTDAIRKAFVDAAASVSKRCVYFPRGVYVIDPSATKEMFVLKSNMSVRGEKNGLKGLSVLKIKDNSIQAQPAGAFRAALAEQMLLGGENAENITVENMVFDGNYRGNRNQIDASYMETNLVNFALVKGLNIKNCAFMNAGIACLVLVQCQNSEIHHNYILDVGQGVHNGDAIQTNGCVKTTIWENVLENVGEGIFCQHRNFPAVADDAATVFNNQISNLEANEASKIRDYIDPSVWPQIQANNLVVSGKAGRAIGSAIGILSNNAKVYGNKIKKHIGISVQAAKGQGDLSTSNIEVWQNEIFQNGKIPYLNRATSQMIRNANGALTVSAVGQTVRNVFIHHNIVSVSFNSGVYLGLEEKTNRANLDNIRIENNNLQGTCANTDAPIFKMAAVLFANVGFTDAANKNKYSRVAIKNNQLGYVRNFGFWFEPCMSEVRIVGNTFVGDKNAKINFAGRSCLKEINQPNDFRQNELNCLLEPNGICIGCTATPPNCSPNTLKCITCE